MTGDDTRPGRGWHPSPARGPLTCRECASFVDNPIALERALPGLTILSSAAGSTRGKAGICELRGTFQDPEPACDGFSPRGVTPR